MQNIILEESWRGRNVVKLLYFIYSPTNSIINEHVWFSYRLPKIHRDRNCTASAECFQTWTSARATHVNTTALARTSWAATLVPVRPTLLVTTANEVSLRVFLFVLLRIQICYKYMSYKLSV